MHLGDERIWYIYKEKGWREWYYLTIYREGEFGRGRWVWKSQQSLKKSKAPRKHALKCQLWQNKASKADKGTLSQKVVVIRFWN